MTLPPEHLQPKAPELSTTDIAEATNELVAQIRREFITRGQPETPVLASLLTDARERIEVTSLHTGPQARYRSPHGGRLNAEMAATVLLGIASERAQLLSYGPDPRVLLVDRLIALGLTRTEAEERAHGRVERLSDGRVVARRAAHDASGSGYLWQGPMPLADREYTTDELATIRDTTRPLEVATRAILAERDAERRENGRSPEDKARVASLVAGAV
jgi:hypothetical protein